MKVTAKTVNTADNRNFTVGIDIDFRDTEELRSFQDALYQIINGHDLEKLEQKAMFQKMQTQIKGG